VRKLDARHDDKLQALIRLLTTDPVLRREKVLIFSEFADTARHLHKQLHQAGMEGVEQLDSASKRDRSDVIRRFSPYYNDSSSAELASVRKKEIRVLISTDILSEGLNLQDCTRLINYDLHWNPVRLMQRIGRVDRRMNPEVEQRIVADHPEQRELRGKVVYWNFLPPDELEELLLLYTRVSHKTLRISKTFGIEGKKLLKPEDDYDALRDFDHAYEGKTTPMEEVLLELQKIMQQYPDLEARLAALPGRVFSGKRHPSEGAKALFLCYRLPKPDHEAKPEDDILPWTEEAGETKWYLYDVAKGTVTDEPSEIIGIIRSDPDTPRHCAVERPTLTKIRKEVDRHIVNTYMKSLQAPASVKPILKAWMELS
jgi:superfamily II DNA/RNA helicase